MFRLSGDQDGTLMVPCPPYNLASIWIFPLASDMSRIITSWPRRMTLHVPGVGKKNNPPAVRRRMGEPVVVIVGRDLFLVRAVRLHAPDLHQTGALGIEVNIFPVRRIIRAVIQTRRRRQPRFLPAAGGNGVNVKFPLRSAQYASVLPSGDQPCQYEGASFVIRRGLPPEIGST